MIENKKVITRSLIVLFLSLSIVYSLTYQKKEKIFKSVAQNGNVTTQTGTENQNRGFTTSTGAGISNYHNGQNNQKTVGGVSLGDTGESSWVSNSNTQDSSTTESSASVGLIHTDVKMLSGTTEYFGVLDIVSILGEKPEFTLQDSKGNYFAYYGDHLDFVQTINMLGGNVYEMVTESEILQNQLFGDRVSYINLASFKDIRVLMVIKIDGDVWLLQIPADQYHQSKDYLKSLFIH